MTGRDDIAVARGAWRATTVSPVRIGLDSRHVPRGLGIATYVSELASALARRPDAAVVPIGRTGAAPYPALDLLPWPVLAHSLRLDVMHFTGNTGWPVHGRTPFVLTVHDLIFFERTEAPRSLRQRAGHAYERLIVPAAVRAADEVIAVSETTAAAVEARFGRVATVIGHGIAVPQEPAPRAAGAPYLVAFGGRDPRKALDLALATYRAAREHVARLEVVARAGVPEGFLRDAAAELAAGTVVVHPDLSRGALDELIRGALALLYLSRSEGFGLPVLEAMAQGTPAITGLAPATRRLAAGAALLVDPADPVGTAAAHARRLAGDPALRARLAEAGRARARAQTWDAVAERHLDAYRRAIGASARHSTLRD
jgi:glycosyltransferase involved in cell wall biosynthesis